MWIEKINANLNEKTTFQTGSDKILSRQLD